MSGTARAYPYSPNSKEEKNPPTDHELQMFTRKPTGHRIGALIPNPRPADPRIPEAFETQPIGTLVIITCHSDACETVTGLCFNKPTFETPYELLFTANYGCPTITYGSFFDVARNLFENIRGSFFGRNALFDGGVLTRAIYATVAVEKLGKDRAGEWLGRYGTLGRSTNLKYHAINDTVSNLNMFGPGTSEAQDVNGVYVFQMGRGSYEVPILGFDQEIRDKYNILNKPEILAQLGIKKSTEEPTQLPSGLFLYPNRTYLRTDGVPITLEYLLNRLTQLFPPKGTLVLPLTCRVLEGDQREGISLVSPTGSQFSLNSPSTNSSHTPISSPQSFNSFFSSPTPSNISTPLSFGNFASYSPPASPPASPGGGKTRRHIRHRHKLTKKYRSRSRSRSKSRSRFQSRTKPKSTKKRGRK
jgi:hypothetical protein